MPKRLLAILAHPDDECFAVSGTLAKYAHAGIETVLLCVTGDLSETPGRQPAQPDEIRKKELLCAARQLGIEVYFLDYQDGSLADTNPVKLLEDIACWIDTVQPQAILTFGPDGISGHPDHVTLSRTVTCAVEKYFPGICLLYIAPSEATALECGRPPSDEGSGQTRIAVDISDFRIEKLRAIQSHASRLPLLKGKPEDELDRIPCHEYFTIAHDAVSNSNDLMDCFKR